jgi:hypothetical protein
MRIPKAIRNTPNKAIQAHIGIYISINMAPPPIKIIPIKVSTKEFFFGQRGRLIIVSHPHIASFILVYAL